MADIDVVIVNYNAGPFLLKAVDSVAQDSRVHRIIVVDNASRDTSMREFCARAAGEPRMIPLQNDRNLGFARACNIGIKAAAGDYLLFLNPDGEVQPGALETMVSAMRINDQVGMAGPLVLNPDGTEQAGSRRAVPTPWRTFVRAFGLSRYSNRYPKLFPDFHLQGEPLPDCPQEVEAISGSCMMLKARFPKKSTRSPAGCTGPMASTSPMPRANRSGILNLQALTGFLSAWRRRSIR